MGPARRPGRKAEHHVHVQNWAIPALGDVADQRQHLALLAGPDTAELPSRTLFNDGDYKRC